MEKLQPDKKLLEKRMYWLNISLNKYSEIGIKSDYSVDEFEFENQGALVDVVNNAHKLGIINRLDEIRLMKNIRNTIVHEYIEDELINVFDQVLEYAQKPMLITQDKLSYLEKFTQK